METDGTSTTGPARSDDMRGAIDNRMSIRGMDPILKAIEMDLHHPVIIQSQSLIQCVPRDLKSSIGVPAKNQKKQRDPR